MTKKVHILGVRVDLGAGRRGVDMGPSAIRKAGMRQALRELGYEVADANNPLELAREADLDGLGIYFDYGTADRYNRSVGLGAGNQKLDQALSKSVDHVFREHEGEPHGWALV